MKGIVFTEFIALVEDKFGLDIADEIIESCDLPSGGAYSSVGTYDFAEMVQLVSKLSELTAISVDDLLKVYGEHLLGRFADKFPVFFDNVSSSFEFLESVDQTIHVEVLKLYPEAELPRFYCERPDPNTLKLNYVSSKPLSALAFGLIVGSSAYFNETLSIEIDDRSEGGSSDVMFTLSK